VSNNNNFLDLTKMNVDPLILGYVSWIGQYAEKNAVLVDILIECGAVPFVRTNIPQTLMVSAPLKMRASQD
jgi:hypothetical protein